MVDRLERDTLIERLTAPRGAWNRVEVHESTGSTNDDAAALAEPHLIVVAAEQTAGRGRRSRSWSSPPGTSVSMSMALPLGSGPPGPPSPLGSGAVRDPGWIPLVVGLGVRDALAGLVPDGPARFVLKWPNDVLVEGARATSAPEPASTSARGTTSAASAASETADGRAPAKIAGILCQLEPAAGLVIAGVGINVTVPVEALPVPEGTASPATSLHLCTPETVGISTVTREDVVEAVAEQVARRHAAWLAGGTEFARLREEYRSACVTVGSEVDVHLPGGEIRRARATGIAADGELEITGPRGAEQVRAGDVIHIRPRMGA